MRLRGSDVCILIAVSVSFVVSGNLWFTGHPQEALFTSIWVPSILAFAIYFKLLGLIAVIKGAQS